MRILLLVIVLMIAACARERWQPEKPLNPLPTKINGASDETIIRLQKVLRKHHVKVVTIGQEYLVSIPAKALFYNQSPRIIWSAHGILNEVVVFLAQFRKVEIHVSAYASKYKSVRREKALTLARARAVAHYLESQGVDSRFIFMLGRGSEDPIGSPCGISDERLEITFREAIV